MLKQTEYFTRTDTIALRSVNRKQVKACFDFPFVSIWRLNNNFCFLLVLGYQASSFGLENIKLFLKTENC